MFTQKSIRQRREMLGLKQIELAKKSGIDRYRLCNAEKGHIQLREEELAAVQRAITAATKKRAKQIEKLAEINSSSPS